MRATQFLNGVKGVSLKAVVTLLKKNKSGRLVALFYTSILYYIYFYPIPVYKLVVHQSLFKNVSVIISEHQE